MIKAILHEGQIHPVEPVPETWQDGQSLDVEASARDPDMVPEFARLVRQWKDETQYLSSTLEIATHPAYQRIIGMGRVVLPLILEDLRREPHQWFWALRAIAGEDPVPKALKGRVREMADIWVRWGQQRGFLQDDESRK